MSTSSRPPTKLRRLLTRSLAASAGLAAGPEPITAAPMEERDMIDPCVENDDVEEDDLVAAGAGELATQLARMSPFEATRIAATAALSSQPATRRTIAEALVSSFRLVGDDFVLDHLERDPDIEVRDAALRARAARGIPPLA